MALALLAAAGCAPLQIADAWVRATPPDAPAAALYGRIVNPGAAPDRGPHFQIQIGVGTGVQSTR